MVWYIEESGKYCLLNTINVKVLKGSVSDSDNKHRLGR